MDARNDESEEDDGGRRGWRSPGWLTAYLSLAALYVVTVSASLYSHHLLLDLHRETLRLDQVWARRLDGFARLGQLADAVADPVNEVFASGDADAGRERLDAALVPFGAHMAGLREELKAALGSAAEHDDRTALRGLESELADIDAAVDGMLEEAERTFAFYRMGQHDMAGVLAGNMNRRRRALTDGMADLKARVHAIVRAHLEEQGAEGEWLARLERAMGGLAVLFVAAIALWGVRLWRELGRDTRRRARQAAAVAASEARKAAMLATSLDAVVNFDSHGRVVDWNPAAERTFGWTYDEAVGRELVELIVPPRLRQAHTEAARAYLDGAGTVVGERLETVGTRRDGAEFPMEYALTKFVLDGEPCFTAYLRDISERRRGEESLRRAMEAAEAATRAKSEFLANMSHEIRTPMNAVVGMTGLLLDTPLSPEQREFVETVRVSSDALLTIINDILDFSKIESGHLELERQPFDLRDCVEEALDLVAIRAGDKGLDLAYEIADGVPAAIVGDVTRLRQILVNLLANAVKFTHDGEVTILVRAADGAGRAGATRLRFDVRDTGIGIPADRMDRLFRSFSQVDASTTRHYGGTGLGLAISKRLAELMGGRMWVESEVGVGSTFSFEIEAEPAASRRRLYPAALQQSLAGRRVLIVDDNETNRRILRLQVESWRMEPRLAATPAQALEWIEAGERFDVAVLDMNMPEMDGLTLAARIRRLRDARSLPLVMLSSAGRLAAADGRLFAASLAKPVKQSQLFEALTGALGAGADGQRRGPEPARALDAGMGERLPLRILLAEDNAVNQKVALRILERLGYRADVAANGLEVLAALARQVYDVVLLDVQMPEMDGLEAARRVNQLWSPAERPRLVAMTANAMQGDREQCLAAGMDDYLVKPVHVAALKEALERCTPIAGPEAATAALGG